MLRFFPPVVTGTIIAVIGISLMRVGINWIFGNPVGPTAPSIVDPSHAQWLAEVTAPGLGHPAPAQGLFHHAVGPQPALCRPGRRGRGGRWCWCRILLIVKYAKGFIANISVLLGIVDRRHRGHRHSAS